MMDRKKKSLVILVFLAALLLVRPATPTTAQFVISAWTFPADQYGQGIYRIRAMENATLGYFALLDDIDYDNATPVFIFPHNSGIRLTVYTEFNNTLVGAASTTEGRNYIRHNITVLGIHDELLFSQENLTYSAVSTAGQTWYYQHSVILDFLTVEGQQYFITVTCEIYYLEDW